MLGRRSFQKGNTLIIFILIIAAALIGVSVSYYFSDRTRVINSEPTPANTEKSAKTVDIDISGWETYSSIVYGYSFKYPSDWSVKEEPIGNSPTSKFSKGMVPYMTKIYSPRGDNYSSISINTEGGAALNINRDMRSSETIIGGKKARLYTFYPDTGFWFYNLVDDEKYPEFSVTITFKENNRKIIDKIISSVNFNRRYYYTAHISKQPTFSPIRESIFSRYLDDKLFLNNNMDSYLVYNTKNAVSPYQYNERGENEGKYNYSFYLITSKLLESAVYEDTNLKVRLTPVDKSLEPFLNNSKYCNVREDCFLRYRMCTQGAYNKYEQFYDVIGCGPSISFDGEDKYPLAKKKADECGEANTWIDVKYSGFSCVNHECTPLNPTVACVEHE